LERDYLKEKQYIGWLRSKMKKLTINMKKKTPCPVCGCEDTDVLSCGTILCHNKKCLKLSSPEKEGERK